MPVPGSPGIQELNPVDVDEIPEVLGIRLFVVPRLGALPGRRAEVVGEHLRKGSRIYVEGRKRTEFWDDKETGAKHYRDLVYVDRIEFLDSRGPGNGHRDPAESAFEESTVTDQEMPF